MKGISLYVFLLSGIMASAQVNPKRSMLGSPFEMIVEAKDIPEADTYIDMAVAEVSRLENLISDWIPTTPISDVTEMPV
jgi:thiamine biosynthesis lipoprotein